MRGIIGGWRIVANYMALSQRSRPRRPIRHGSHLILACRPGWGYGPIQRLSSADASLQCQNDLLAQRYAGESCSAALPPHSEVPLNVALTGLLYRTKVPFGPFRSKSSKCVQTGDPHFQAAAGRRNFHVRCPRNVQRAHYLRSPPSHRGRCQRRDHFGRTQIQAAVSTRLPPASGEGWPRQQRQCKCFAC